MKKTYNINLYNQFFHIDEDAYVQLLDYIATLEKYYLDEEDGKEIMMDIESRIAELFQEFLQKNHKQIISQSDVDNVIEIMGTPDAIFEEDTEPHSPRKNKVRKLYRDPDDALIGGVAAGFAGYFSISITWVRLLFILCGLFYGFSVIVYIILWIILPQATTAKQKLEMKGKKINVSNIEKNIRDTYTKVKTDSRFKKITNTINQQFNTFFSICKELLNQSGTLIFSILSVTGIVFGIIGLVVTCWSIFFSYHFAPENYYTFFRYAISPVPIWLIKLILLLIAVIPLFLITYYSIRYLFKLQKHKGVFLICTGLWILCCLSGVFIGIYQARNYAQEYQNKTEIPLLSNNPQKHSLYVTFKASPKPQYNCLFQSKLDNYILHYSDKQEADSSILYLKPEIAFATTGQEYPELIISKQARGFSGIEAVENTENMEFHYEWRNDTLQLDNYYKLNSNLWRANNLEIKILIPEKYKITLNNPPRKNINYLVFQDRNKFLFTRRTPDTRTYIMKKGKLVEVN